MNNLIKVESWNSFVFVVDEMKAGIPKFEHFIIFQHFKWKQRKTLPGWDNKVDSTKNVYLIKSDTACCISSRIFLKVVV